MSVWLARCPNLSRARQGLVRLLRIPPREMLTTVRVVATIVTVELLIRWVALPRLARLLGVRVSLEPALPGNAHIRTTEFSPRARRELRCTRRVADRWPLSQGPCLRRALVGGHLLRRYNPSVRIGMAGTGDDLYAHAWLEINEQPLENVRAFEPFQQPTTGVAE